MVVAPGTQARARRRTHQRQVQAFGCMPRLYVNPALQQISRVALVQRPDTGKVPHNCCETL